MMQIKSDMAIQISSELGNDDRTSGAAIEVIDDGAGVITLHGVVSSNEIVEAAKEIAAAQDGVVSVTGDLRVEPEDMTLWPYTRRPL